MNTLKRRLVAGFVMEALCPMSVMLDTRDLTKTFGSPVAVDHVDMSVKREKSSVFSILAITVVFALVDVLLIRVVSSSFGVKTS